MWSLAAEGRSGSGALLPPSSTPFSAAAPLAWSPKLIPDRSKIWEHLQHICPFQRFFTQPICNHNTIKANQAMRAKLDHKSWLGSLGARNNLMEGTIWLDLRHYIIMCCVGDKHPLNSRKVAILAKQEDLKAGQRKLSEDAGVSSSRFFFEVFERRIFSSVHSKCMLAEIYCHWRMSY